MRISDWSSDVCSSDLGRGRGASASRDRADADEREQRRQQGRESIAHLFLPAACRSEPAFARSPIPPPSRDSGTDMPTFGRAAARSSSIPISKSLSYRGMFRLCTEQCPSNDPCRTVVRRVGKECVSTCKYWRSPYLLNKHSLSKK